MCMGGRNRRRRRVQNEDCSDKDDSNFSQFSTSTILLSKKLQCVNNIVNIMSTIFSRYCQLKIKYVDNFVDNVTNILEKVHDI